LPAIQIRFISQDISQVRNIFAYPLVSLGVFNASASYEAGRDEAIERFEHYARERVKTVRV
jgi:hypothetical protein